MTAGTRPSKESGIRIIVRILLVVAIIGAVWLLAVRSKPGSRPAGPSSTPLGSQTNSSALSTPSVMEGHNHAIEDRAYVYAGIPKPLSAGSRCTLLQNEGYWAGYSESRKNPLWVSYRVFQIDNPKTFPRPSRFKTDPRTATTVKHRDYTHSGYDRGHMAPNFAIVSRYGRRAQLETFFMSNICPQVPLLNRGIWKHLEGKVANEYSNPLEEVWVVTGPIFDNERATLPSGVEIPDQFFKIIVDEDQGVIRMLAFIIPQEVQRGEQLEGFLTSVDIVEAAAHLDFFWQLADGLEERLEAVSTTRMW